MTDKTETDLTQFDVIEVNGLTIKVSGLSCDLEDVRLILDRYGRVGLSNAVLNANIYLTETAPKIREENTALRAEIERLNRRIEVIEQARFDTTDALRGMAR